MGKRLKNQPTTRATRTVKKKIVAPAPADDLTLRLNLPDGELYRHVIADPRDLQRQAIRWNYVLRNRQRWNGQSDVVARQEREIIDLAHHLEITKAFCARIADATLVEVDVPWVAEDRNWELRVFPWEFLLASATREFRQHRPLTVVRRLRIGEGGTPAAPHPTQWLHVQSEPGPLAGNWDFSSEQELLAMCVKSLGGKVESLRNPDRQMLATRVQAGRPNVIHLSGFDSHQGVALLAGTAAGDRLRSREKELPDGYLVRSPEEDGARTNGRAPTVLGAEDLANVLTDSGKQAPSLVACNIYNSGARIAPLAVAAGAHAALGFLDSFDDELAELFFTTFYRAWGTSGWDSRAAFQFAWSTVRDTNRPLQGSGVVLWSRQSILDASLPRKTTTTQDVAAQISTQIGGHARPVRPDKATEDLAVDVKVVTQLNYSLLHNNGSVFERFLVRKTDAAIGKVENLLVHVELHVGTDSYPFRMQADIAEAQTHTDLVKEIRLSLASSLSRAIRESIHTSLLVEVHWGETILYQQTHRVTLLPVDEWRFDPGLDHWLPSFVLPRDPAVLRVIDSAQRYLMSLRDDATAGFDGYQCVDPENPEAPTIEECVDVDMQVRALWSALLYETPLSYINPPPVFTGSSQRLRTPSDCIDGKRGTCIDLALLMASCLEYVEIYPAIILLKTHAFPAYWRHEVFHQQFRDAHFDAGETEQDLAKGPPSSAAGQSVRWQFGRDQYREIIGAVQSGRLVPLETTLVTGHGSFAEAVTDGRENLASRREFESMLDIIYARTDELSSVTPLPIRRAEA